jgi:hypothetical protein
MSMRELPFGARLADSFVKKLKWDTVKARDESPGVLPCLCIEERQRQVRTEGQAKRIDFEERLTVPGVNRLAPPAPSRFILIKERAWVLCFEKRMKLALRQTAEVIRGRKHRPKTIFEIDGLELHVSEQAQAELKGSTIRVVNDKIVVSYDHI